MIDLEKRYLNLRLRAWGLIANFLANAVAVYGLTEYFNAGSASVLIIGLVLSIGSMLVLAMPSK